MKAHIEAIKEALTPSISTYYVSVPDDAPYPYVLLWGTPGGVGIEAAITPSDDMSDLLGVTIVDTTPYNVLRATDIVRGILNGLQLAVTGRCALLSYEFSEAVQPDKTITLPDTNLHPFYAVDRYRLTDTPA